MPNKLHLPIANLDNSVATLENGHLYSIVMPYDLNPTDWLDATFFSRLCRLKPVIYISDDPAQRFNTPSPKPHENGSDAPWENAWPSPPQLSVLKNSVQGVLFSEPFIEALSMRNKHKAPLIFIECSASQLQSRQGPHLEIEQNLDNMKRWAIRHSSIIVLLVRECKKSLGVISTLLSSHTHFSGTAEWKTDQDQPLIWHAYYWHTAFGVVSRHTQKVSREADGELVADYAEESVVHEDDEWQPLEHQRPLIVHAPFVDGVDKVPDNCIVEEDLNEILKKTIMHHAVAVVLCYTHQDTIAALFASIHEVRDSYKSETAIFIREINEQIRYSDECTLIRLGANAILPHELAFSRCLQFIDLHLNQSYSKPLSKKDISRLTNTTPAHHKIHGYLSRTDFIQLITTILVDTKSIKIKHALIKFRHIDGISQFELLKTCLSDRPLDTFTATESHTYLFLYGCQDQDITRTIKRIFHLPTEDIFESEQRFTLHNDIEWALSDLNEEPELYLTYEQKNYLEKQKDEQHKQGDTSSERNQNKHTKNHNNNHNNNHNKSRNISHNKIMQEEPNSVHPNVTKVLFPTLSHEPSTGESQ